MNTTGEKHFNAGGYDPHMGRFTTEYPIRDGLNWYIYANNNPLRFVDPTGLANVIAGDIVQETVSNKIFSSETGSIKNNVEIDINRTEGHTEGHYLSNMQINTTTKDGEVVNLYDNPVHSWADKPAQDETDFTLPAGSYEGQLRGRSKAYDKPIHLMNNELGVSESVDAKIHPNEQTYGKNLVTWSRTGSGLACQINQGQKAEYDIFTKTLESAGFKFGEGSGYTDTITVNINDPKNITTMRDSGIGRERDVHNLPR